MTENQIKQIRNQLPEGERIDRMYSAYEGGIRVITKNAAKQEIRYRVIFGPDESVTIERF